MQDNITNKNNSQIVKSLSGDDAQISSDSEVVRVFLIGYMGVGKTTVGKKLAKSLGIGFIDLDKFIESKYHKTVPELFADRGENEFRLIEQKSLIEVSEIENVVISTGGGAPCFFANMELMNKTGITVYIQAEPEELAARLRASKTVRPIVSGKAKEELVPFITNHLSEREKFYGQAQIVYKTDHLVTKEDVHLTVNGIAYEIKKLKNDI